MKAGIIAFGTSLSGKIKSCSQHFIKNALEILPLLSGILLTEPRMGLGLLHKYFYLAKEMA